MFPFPAFFGFFKARGQFGFQLDVIRRGSARKLYDDMKALEANADGCCGKLGPGDMGFEMVDGGGCNRGGLMLGSRKCAEEFLHELGL